jgi:anti-sigma28 factor (negative regulator of flagellin synthesis)
MELHMQISDVEVQKILDSKKLVAEIVEIGQDRARVEDAQIVKEVTEAVMKMPDREDRIQELKAKIEAGTYHVTGEQIAESMIRRNIADKIQ